MRYTLLEMTQEIMDSMDSDEVNSISDMSESLVVAKIIRQNYFDIISELPPKETQQIFHLDASGDFSKPTLMTRPSYVEKVREIRYNVSKDVLDTNLREVRYLPFTEFLEHSNGLDRNASWVGTMSVSFGHDDFIIKYRTDKYPSYWTSYDDHTILMDSVDLREESTLVAARTYCLGDLGQHFPLDDTFIPNLDEKHFPLLLAASKAQAFAEVKQTQNPNAERKERKGRIVLAQSRDSTDPRPAVRKKKGYGR